MTDYSKLSDQEINLLIAEILNPDSTVIESKSRPPSACITGHLPSLWVDYCNNPADAWPIIEKEEISIIFNHFSYGIHAAIGGKSGNVIYDDANPLRAAMVVSLVIEGFR